MAKKTQQAIPESGTPDLVNLRLPWELQRRVERLMPDVMSDKHTSALLGRLSKSALYRLAITEGLRVLEKRYSKRDAA